MTDARAVIGAAPARACVVALASGYEELAGVWAQRLRLPRGETSSMPAGDGTDFWLTVGSGGLSLLARGHGSAGPVRVDFTQGQAAHRRQFGGGSGQMIARVIGVQSGVRPRVLDATAGLGRDAFVLASLGCDVVLAERQPIVAALLEDGLARARLDPSTAPIVAHMRLMPGDACALFDGWQGVPPQVIYLDPMFPQREKSALVKKEMRFFHDIVGQDDDAPVLLDKALALASHRVVVKRPRHAPALGDRPPGYALEGKSSRFDVYPKKAFKAGG